MSHICHSSSSAIPTAAIYSLASTAACRFGRGWNSGALVSNFAGIACSVLSHGGNRCSTTLSNTDVPVRIFAPRIYYTVNSTYHFLGYSNFPLVTVLFIRFDYHNFADRCGVLDLLPCC